MKKTYVSPTMMVVAVNTQKMIAASNEVSIGSDYNGGAVGARQGGFWDDEDE